MGSVCNCCASEEQKADSRITGYMDTESRQTEQMKLLLLGCGSAGKSTLFKSLRMSHAGGIDANDLQSIIPLIRQHCVEAILKLYAQSQLLYHKDSIQHKECRIDLTQELTQHVTSIEEFKNTVCLDDQSDEWESVDFQIMSKLATYIDFIWKLPAIQATYHKRGKHFALEDNSDYYLNQVEAIFDQHYLPSIQDYLKVKQRTVGMFAFF